MRSKSSFTIFAFGMVMAKQHNANESFELVSESEANLERASSTNHESSVDDLKDKKQSLSHSPCSKKKRTRKYTKCPLCFKGMRRDHFLRHLCVHKKKMEKDVEKDKVYRDKLASIVCDLTERISLSKQKNDALLANIKDNFKNNTRCNECGRDLGYYGTRILCNKTFCSNMYPVFE